MGEKQDSRKWNELSAEEQEARRKAYSCKSIKKATQDFVATIMNKHDETPAIPTGFSILDGPEALDGGLYPGLYIIGAMPSAGKTAFVEQIVDHIAAAGNDVLFFSLEMSTFELIARSISRKTYEIAKINVESERRPKEYLKCARKTRDLMRLERFLDFSVDELEIMNAAQVEYRDTSAPNLYIFEADGQIGVDYVRQQVEEHYNSTGRRAVIVIDYIQLLKPADVRATDKQNMDFNMLTLKQISRDFKAPLIGISSYSRTGYEGEARMQSARDSSSIEYSCDVMLGIHYKGAEDKENFDIDEAKNKEVREIVISVLKNRNGVTGTKILFEYISKYNYFRNMYIYQEKKNGKKEGRAKAIKNAL